jgi:hypothetical protein
MDGLRIKVRYQAGARDKSLLHNVQTGSGAYPASYKIDSRGSYPGSKSRGVKLTILP